MPILQRLTELLNEDTRTATELSTLAGCNKQTVINIRKGLNEPSLSLAERLFTVLGYSIQPAPINSVKSVVTALREDIKRMEQEDTFVETRRIVNEWDL